MNRRTVLDKLQSLINSILALDEHSMKQLVELEGKTLRLSISDFSRDICLRIVADGIEFDSGIDEFDVSIHGKAIALMGLLTAGKGGASFPKDITLQGDIHFAQQIQAIAREMDIDWEELLSRYVGDIAAHQMGRAIKTGVRAAKDIFQSLQNSSSEYLRYEAEVLPDQGLIDEFSRDVETLRDDTERLSQRVQRLQNRVSKKVDD